MGLLSPAWLAGLAALLVPLLIHLWSRRARRTVRVGSVRFFSGAPPRFRSARLTDVAVLMLRGAILVAIVLGLAGLYGRSGGAAPAAGVVLVDADLARDTTDRDPVLDSLRRVGAEIQTLEPGANLWSQLREADRRFGGRGAELLVVAPARLASVHGERPRLASRVRWHAPVASPDSLPTFWLDRAWVDRDSATVVIGRSSAAGTSFRRLAVPIPTGSAVLSAPAEPSVEARRLADGTWRFAFVRSALPRPGDTLTVPAPDPRRVTIYASRERREAARYVAAAFRAAAGGAGPAAVVELRASTDSVTPAGAASDPQGAWSVWLADAPVPAALEAETARGAVLLTDRRSADSTLSVTRTAVGRGRRYELSSRLDPATAPLALGTALPETIATLWAGQSESERARAADRRRTSIAQLAPVTDTAVAQSRAAAPQPAESPYARPLWLLAVLLFAAERLVAARRARSAA